MFLLLFFILEFFYTYIYIFFIFLYVFFIFLIFFIFLLFSCNLRCYEKSKIPFSRHRPVHVPQLLFHSSLHSFPSFTLALVLLLLFFSTPSAVRRWKWLWSRWSQGGMFYKEALSPIPTLWTCTRTFLNYRTSKNNNNNNPKTNKNKALRGRKKETTTANHSFYINKKSEFTVSLVHSAQYPLRSVKGAGPKEKENNVKLTRK